MEECVYERRQAFQILLRKMEMSFISHLASSDSCYIHCGKKLLRCRLHFSLNPDVDSFSPCEDSSSRYHYHTYLFHTRWHGSLSFSYAGGLPSGSISRLLITVFTLPVTHMGDAAFPVLLSLRHMLDKLFTSDHIPVV